MWGGGYSFSMLHMWRVTKVKNVHFVAFCDTFCRILRQPFLRKSRTFAPNFKAR